MWVEEVKGVGYRELYTKTPVAALHFDEEGWGFCREGWGDSSIPNLEHSGRNCFVVGG